MKHPLGGLILMFAVGLAALAMAATSATADRRTDTLTIAAYSVAREALHEGILPAFAEHWKQATGRSVWFEESYNGSGAQVRAIQSGLDADIALLSHEGDMQKLVKAGLVRSTWNQRPDRGMITHSLVVIGHRPGNPRHISGWDDLTRPGITVLYPDPKTSGGARWNINAIYGAGLLTSGSREAARELLARVQARVLTMESSGRQSMATFERGSGDAVVSYENELVLLGKVKGEAVPYVVPNATLLIESPAAIVDASVERHGNRPLAEAFLAFLRSSEGQRILGRYGFRPIDGSVPDAIGRPLPAHLFTMADLGGWSKADKAIYGPGGVWDSLFTNPVKKR